MKYSYWFLKRSILYVLTVLLVMLTCIGIASVKVKAASGKTGDCTWEYDEGSERLTIIGPGDMSSYLRNVIDPKDPTPWGNYKSSMKSIAIRSDVTRIGNYAFMNCNNVSEIRIPPFTSKIGYYAFNGCSNLSKIYFYGNAPEFANTVFAGVTATAYYPKGDNTWKTGNSNSYSNSYGGNITWKEWNPTDYPVVKTKEEQGGDDSDDDHPDATGNSNELNFDKDVFSFRNFTHKSEKNESDKYCRAHMSKNDLASLYLRETLSDAAWERVNKELSTIIGGHCFGFSTAAILNKIHEIDFGNNNYNLRALSKSSAMGKICYYQYLTVSDVAYNNFANYIASQKKYIKAGQNNTVIYLASDILKEKEIEGKASTVKNGGTPVRICYAWWDKKGEGWTQSAHAVVGYAYEPISSRTYGGVSYNKRILIYDSNSSDSNGNTVWNEKYCIYYNDEGDWCIPAYDNCSSQNGAYFYEASNTLSLLKCTNSLGTTQPTVSMSQDQSLTVTDETTGKTAALNPSAGPSAADQNWQSFVYPADSVNDIEKINYILPSKTNSYSFAPSSGKGKIDFYLVYDGKYIAVSADSASKVKTSPAGNIVINGCNGNYKITLVDDSKQKMNYDNFQLTGKGTGDISVKLTDQGVEISGGSAVTIIAKGKAEERKVTVTRPVAFKFTQTDIRNKNVSSIGSSVRLGKAVYKITSASSAELVSFDRNAPSTVKIPAAVKLFGKTYKVTSIASGVFKNNKKIKNVNINSNVVSIGSKAFSCCTNLRKVTLSKNLRLIGSKAFYKCKMLKHITFKGKKLKKIRSKAFKGIYKKASIKMPKAVKKKYKKLIKKAGAPGKVKYR